MTPDEYDQLAGYFVPLSASEKPIVISGKHTYATQAKVVLKHLAAPRREAPPQTPPASRDETPARRNIIIR